MRRTDILNGGGSGWGKGMRLMLVLGLLGLLCADPATAARKSFSQRLSEKHQESTDPGVRPETRQPLYACPMHPDQVSDKPGKCPKCGMFLVLQEEGTTDIQHQGNAHAIPMQQARHADEGMSEQGMEMPAGQKPARYWEHPQERPAASPANSGATPQDLTHSQRLQGTPAEETQTAEHKTPMQSHEHAHAAHETYVCPMHPQIVSHDPDATCPICGMDLEAKQVEPAASALPQIAQGEKTYVCPMHPQIVQHAPGSCPICGMDLVAKESAAPAGDHPQVYLSAAVIQNMGVRTARVESRALGKTVLTQGMVTADDDRISYIHPKAGGWVKNLYPVTEGDRVERKDELVDFYSPWINKDQLDFIEALEEYDTVSFDPSRKTELAAKVEAARNALRLLGVSPMDLMRIENSRKVLDTIQMMSPQSGVITELNVNEGTYIEPYQRMFTIVDLSKVWVMVDIYEHQAPWVRQGYRAKITAPAIPGRNWTGKVDYIYPEVNPKSRTLRARIEVSNPDEALLLNMFVQVEITANATKGEVLSVPREAVILTGEREVVILSRGKGHFQPVEVTTGIWSDNQAEILSGLSEGDEVVVSGQFLIDSESSLQASFLRMTD